MNPTFFDKIQPALAVERLDAYRQGQALALDVMSGYVVFLKSEEGGRE